MNLNDITTLRRFINPNQLLTMIELSRGEEGEFFRTQIEGWARMIQIMPKTYEQDGKGDDAIVYLHYFFRGMDWYILERDLGPGQHQAFGYTNLGDPDNAEMGYISIVELLANEVEFDLYWELCTLREVKGMVKLT